jgi:hypothetical protein
MQHRVNGFARLILLSTLSMIVAIFLAILVFQKADAISGSAILHYSLAALGYIAAIFLALGSKLRWFRFDFSAVQDDRKAYDGAMLTFGKIPLSSMVISIAISMLFCAAIGQGGDAFGLADEGRGMFTLLIMSFGLMASAYNFVLGNVVLTKHLAEFKLSRFPLQFNYLRRSLCDLTVPCYMTIMTSCSPSLSRPSYTAPRGKAPSSGPA